MQFHKIGCILATTIENLLEKINPTPAVCGIPMQKAKQLIAALENHNRELYTGFIGPMGINNHHSLFVNLRNMKICNSHLALFLGGGIMRDSIPINEWDETENKAPNIRVLTYRKSKL